jgi:transcription initiation factor IIE alpha subunit
MATFVCWRCGTKHKQNTADKKEVLFKCPACKADGEVVLNKDGRWLDPWGEQINETKQYEPYSS